MDQATEQQAGIEMPRYRSHKTVWALKIKSIEQAPADQERHNPGGDWYLVPEDPAYSKILVGHDYYSKHQPAVGGYYVVYADGYKSFSPALAFEEGNTLIQDGAHQHQAAINVLEAAALACENNAPIHADEGNSAQAEASKANGDGYRAAIDYLQAQ